MIQTRHTQGWDGQAPPFETKSIESTTYLSLRTQSLTLDGKLRLLSTPGDQICRTASQATADLLVPLATGLIASFLMYQVPNPDQIYNPSLLTPPVPS